MFLQRLGSGIVLVILALFFIFQGGWVLLVTCMGISLIGMYELYRVFGIQSSAPAFIGYGAAVLYYLDLATRCFSQFLGSGTVLVLIGLLIVLLGVYVFAYPKYHIKDILGAFFGVVYIPLLISFIFLLRDTVQGGRFFVWLIFLCSWGCDTFAYCAGRLLGTRKMAPILSPKKTVEGGIGGLVGVFLLVLLYGFLFQKPMGLSLEAGPGRMLLLAFFGIVCGVVSMIGDLAASAIKRNYDIKDYGDLIPGHGGIMDRFDSVIMTAPVVYYAVLLLQGA